MWPAGDGVCGYGGDEAPFFVDGELVMNICGRKNANFKDLTLCCTIFLWLLFAGVGWSFDKDDLEKLKTTKQCRQCDLTGADLYKMPLGGAVLVKAKLADAILTDAALYDADLTGADLTGAKLCNAKLFDAKLNNAVLVDADLSGAKLLGAKFTGANLTRACLIRSDLTGADLTGANLSAADLTRAVISHTHFKRTKLSHAIWPDGTTCNAGSIGTCQKKVSK